MLAPLAAHVQLVYLLDSGSVAPVSEPSTQWVRVSVGTVWGSTCRWGILRVCDAG